MYDTSLTKCTSRIAKNVSKKQQKPVENDTIKSKFYSNSVGKENVGEGSHGKPVSEKEKSKARNSMSKYTSADH